MSLLNRHCILNFSSHPLPLLPVLDSLPEQDDEYLVLHGGRKLDLRATLESQSLKTGDQLGLVRSPFYSLGLLSSKS